MQINSLNSNQNFDGSWIRREYSEIKPVPLGHKLGIYYVTEDMYCPNQTETTEEIAKAMASNAPFIESGNSVKEIDPEKTRFIEHKVTMGPRINH